MLTRDSERVIETLLLAAALTAAIGFEFGHDTRSMTANEATGTMHRVVGLETRPLASAEASGSAGASLASISVGPFDALGTQVRRAFHDLVASPVGRSTRRC